MLSSQRQEVSYIHHVIESSHDKAYNDDQFALDYDDFCFYLNQHHAAKIIRATTPLSFHVTTVETTFLGRSLSLRCTDNSKRGSPGTSGLIDVNQILNKE
jgi:hypothetical protein